MPSRRLSRRCSAVVLACCAALAGCAATVTPTLVQPPPPGAATLIIGEIAADDPQARRLGRFLRTAMVDRLLRAEVFAVIYDNAAGEISADALFLDGAITEAERGSDAWRFVLGSGFGRPHFSALFTIADAAGTARVSFAASSDEEGPGGLTGHWEPLSMERVAADLGVEAADAIVRWTRGETFTAPFAIWSQ